MAEANKRGYVSRFGAERVRQRHLQLGCGLGADA